MYIIHIYYINKFLYMREVIPYARKNFDLKL